MSTFIVKGPFEVPVKIQKTGAKTIDKEELDKLASRCPTFGEIGCYVFSLKAAKGSKPLYVGKTEKQTISNEAFGWRNKNLVNEALNDQKRGKLQIWTVTQHNARGPKNKSAIGEIEKVITSWAIEKNPNLLNSHNTKKGDSWSIKGVQSSSRGIRPQEAIAFRKMMGLHIRKEN